jgi:hypothetical protein
LKSLKTAATATRSTPTSGAYSCVASQVATTRSRAPASRPTRAPHVCDLQVLCLELSSGQTWAHRGGEARCRCPRGFDRRSRATGASTRPRTRGAVACPSRVWTAFTTRRRGSNDAKKCRRSWQPGCEPTLRPPGSGTRPAGHAVRRSPRPARWRTPDRREARTGTTTRVLWIVRREEYLLRRPEERWLTRHEHEPLDDPQWVRGRSQFGAQPLLTCSRSMFLIRAATS